jgi:hypothetical protein
MKRIRALHFYLGVFFAPLVIFYAFTGSLQVFKLHEAYRATPGAPGDWIAWFGNFHKEQAWIAPRPAPAKAAPSPSPSPAGEGKAARQERSPWAQPMKWLVAAMGMALAATACLGLYMAFSYPSRRRNCTITLACGIVIPLVLMAT